MYKEDKYNPFGDEDTGADLDVHGSLDIPASGRMVARPVGLDEIRPDLKQPRRAIPQKVRGDWNGNPAKIRDLLMKWKIQCQMQTGKQVDDLGDVLTGMAELPDEYEDYPGIVGAWVELIRLAQRIYAEGLQNPITIYNADGQKYILTGERRYLAHWLLRLEVDREAWSKIPAQVVSYSVRQQISENTARRDLNAVGLARCYAMIVMELYREEGKDFRAFAEVVRPGQCDRAYYAQVADMPAPYGKSGEVMSALNVKNRMSVSRYKSVLNITDDVWMRADDEDWSLTAILEWIDAQKPQPARETVTRKLQFDDDKTLTPQPPLPEQERGSYTPPSASPTPSVRENVQRVEHFNEGEKMPEAPRERATYIGSDAPPVLDDATFLVTDIEIEALVGLAADIAKNRGEMNAWEIISWLLRLDTDNFSHYDGDVDALNDELLVAVDLVKTVIEDVLDRLENWQVERITSEFEDAHGLR
ncbi:MAG: ParB N-terminal domain-containing protein [Aggregatilineales bacterium]